MNKKKEIIEEKADVKETAPAFTKEQFINSKTYSQYKDYLSAALDDTKTYTKEQVNEMISKYYRKAR